MKIAGVVIGIVGFIILMMGLNMDTTVAVSDVYSSSFTAGARVHNSGLLSDRQNSIMLGLAFVIIGVMLYGFGSVAQSRAAGSGGVGSPSEVEPVVLTSDDLMRAIAQGDEAKVREVIASGLDLNEHPGSMTYLEYADLYNQHRIKELILVGMKQ
ncbi:hypothetical protein [Pseudomonas bharatica]|uniref:hypothetical protein n=1 Tax=Pseudomonas bharatica TaxID=2692112 RepID=UPI003B27B4F9